MQLPVGVDRIETLLQRHQADPYPLYRQLRDRGPVLVDSDGKTIVLGYTDARAVLLDPNISVDPRTSRWYEQRAHAGEISAEERQRDDDAPFIELDPPQHTRLRLLVSQAFAARAAEAGPRVQQVVDECLDQIAVKGRCDAVRDVAYAIPINVLCELLDIAKSDRQRLQDWCHFISRSMDPSNPVDPADVEKVQAEFRGYLDQLVTQRALTPGDDLVSALIRTRDAGQQLTAAEVSSAIWLLLISGQQTTSSLIASGIYSLVTDPALRKRLTGAPEKIPALVDELLRLTPLVQFLFRHVKQDVTLPCGIRLSRGTTVVVLLAAANRDPDHFPDPDTLDVDRAGPRHLSYGAGVHYCLGATLGRLQTSIALATFSGRVVEPELAGELTSSPLSLGGLTSLPVGFADIVQPVYRRT